MKKGLAVFLVLMLASFFVFIGCSGGEEPAGKETASGNETELNQQESVSQPQTVAGEESLKDLFTKGRNINELSYQFTMSFPTGELTGMAYIKGEKMRTEMELQGQKVVMIADADANIVYNYMPDEKTAIKLDMSELDEQVDSPKDFISLVDYTKANVIENVQYQGVQCKVIEVLESDSSSPIKMWIREDIGIPIRVESVEAGETGLVIEFNNLEIGPIDSSLFELPADTEILDMEAMLQQMMSQ